MYIEQKQNRIYKPTSNTTLSAEESNQVTTELQNLITAGSLTPSAGTLTQVRDAVQNVVNVAKNDLQEQIDAITSASDVFDVVGTYAELQAYDTSTVPINDIIKVLQDSTHNNAATYYRLVDESGALTWQYVGQEGPYYTKSETDLTFATKAELPGIATTQQVGLVKPDGQTVTIQADGTLNVSSNVAAALPLFTSIWADHILNNASYLRADTFSWQSGSVYTSAYAHLVDDIDGITSETETVAGTTITFYRATDGHKIVDDTQVSNVEAIYTATGVAWYYVLDTTNTRFKLPRSKYNFVGLRDTVGNYVAESLPNINGTFTFYKGGYGGGGAATGAFSISADGTVAGNVAGEGGAATKATFNAHNSNATYQNDAPVQQRATQAYLYFFVGNTIQNETSVDVAELAEDLNGKADLDLANVNNTGTSRGASWAFPSTTYDTLTQATSGTEFTAPANGWYVMNYNITSNSGYAGLNIDGYAFVINGYQQWNAPYIYPVKKGNKIKLNYYGATMTLFRFYYAEGSKSEA